MSLKSEDVRSSLRRHLSWLTPDTHEQVIGALRKDGLVEDHAGAIRAAADNTTQRAPAAMTVNACAAKHPEHTTKLRNVIAMARTLGFEIDPTKVISVHALDKALAGKDVGDRLRLKTALASLNLVPLR